MRIVPPVLRPRVFPLALRTTALAVAAVVAVGGAVWWNQRTSHLATAPVAATTAARAGVTGAGGPGGDHTVAATGGAQGPGTSSGNGGGSGGSGAGGATDGGGASGAGGAVPGGAPTAPSPVCGNAQLLDGPSSPPAGAVVVQPGASLPSVVARYPQGHTTFWLAPGTFTLGTTRYSQVAPAAGDTFVGAPGAVIDGRHRNRYAFTQRAPHVTIEYLTIQNFGSSGENNNQGVVNHDSGNGWVIEHNTIQGNAGAGVMLGSNDVLRGNCLTQNGQYGFSAYSPGGVSHVVVTGNEVSDNDTDNWEVRSPGCGCSGGGKFWNTHGATVTGNDVHDNHYVGLWADTNNTGFTITGNYISGNYAEGIIYEISYNALIADNTLVRNALVSGPANPGFPDGAIYLSNSGSDPRVPGPYGSSLQVTGNVLEDNWAGVVLWEDADRFCGSPDNTSSGYCTLVNPSKIKLSTCTRGHLGGAKPGQGPVDYYDDCRWKTQRVSVTGNTFVFDPKAVGPKCSAATSCGLQGLFSQYGTSPSWSPYKGEVVERAITRAQGNRFADNTYRGPWKVMVHDQSQVVRFATWQHRWGQDVGSTISGA